MLFSPQIPLQLEPTREHRFEDFVAGPNAAVVAELQAVLEEGEHLVFLSGPQGSGKTHLLNALCLAARARGLTAFKAGLRSSPDPLPSMLEGLEHVDLVCIDDLHLVAGDNAWEEALFHLLNRVRASQGRIVLASRERLSALALSLPDLASRLQWGLRLQLLALDDDDKIAVLGRYAASLGIDLPEEVGRYLIRHSSRDLRSLLNNVEQLQRVAFSAQRRVTVPLAREILRRTAGD